MADINVKYEEYLSLLKISAMIKQVIANWKRYPRADLTSVFKVIEEELDTYESLRTVADRRINEVDGVGKESQ